MHCVRDAEGPRGPVDLGFGPTEAERRPQVRILSHRLQKIIQKLYKKTTKIMLTLAKKK